MPLSLQHDFDRRIVSRPEVARRLVLAVPTHLQNPVCRNRPQVVGATGGALALPGILAIPRVANQRGRSCSTTSYALDVAKFARSISSAVRTFVLRCACNGTPTARVANTNASNPGLIFDMCPPSKVLSHVPT